MKAFTETQRFRQGWVWLILAFCAYTAIYTAVSLPDQRGGLPILVSVIVLILLWRLDTRYDAEGVHYRVWPFMNWRTIHWSAVERADVTPYNDGLPYVGYGVRWNFGEWVYNVAGNQGLRIRTTAGKRILLGTQRPDELRTFLKRLPVSVQ